MRQKYEHANGTLEGRAKSLEQSKQLERFGNSTAADTDTAGGGIPTPKSTLEEVRPEEVKDETDHLERGDPPEAPHLLSSGTHLSMGCPYGTS